MTEEKNKKADPSSIPSLVRLLEHDSRRDVYNVLAKIRSKLSQNNKIREFFNAGGVKAILPFLEKPKLLDLTLSILANCCLDSEAREWMLANNGYRPILQVFQCLASETIQNRCCRALANLALSPRGSFVLHKENILSSVVKFLTETTNPLSQQTAVRAIRLLTCGSLYKTLLVEEDGVVPVVDLLKAENHEVVLSAVKTLASLTEHCTHEIAQHVQRSVGLPTIVTLCTSDDRECKEYALTTLINLSTQSVIRPVLGNIGAIPLLIRLIDNPESRKPNLNSVVTALCFYCRESVNRVKIRDNDGLKTLLNLLSSKNNSAIRDKVVFSLLAFRYDEASLDVLMELGLIMVLVNLLYKYVCDNEQDHATAFEMKEDELEDCQNTNAMENIIPVNRRCDKSGISKDEENEILSVLKVAKLSKVFCIHSPSYQLVQTELQNDLGSDVKTVDQKYGEAHSPSSVTSYCLSPDQSSQDWSLPGSPSSRANWSPSAASIPSVTSNQGFDISPFSSPGCSYQYSPVLHNDSYSDVEATVSEERDASFFCKDDLLVADEAPKPLPKRRLRKRTNSENSVSNKSKLSRTDPTTCSASSSVTGIDAKSSNPTREEEEDTVGGHIMQLLSHLSQMDKHSVALATEQSIVSILCYLCRLPYVSSRAKRLLFRLLGNYNCFEALILFDIVNIIDGKITLKHMPRLCRFCAKLDHIKRRSKNILSSVSESGYGIGIMSHIILTGTSPEIAKCVLAIPHLIRGHYQLRKLLCDCGGLTQLLQLLDSNSEQQCAALQSLSALCQNCFSHAFKCFTVSNQNESKTKCFYKNANYDIEFQLDHDNIVKANRGILSSKSAFFNAMLEGSFLESQNSKIKLGEVTSKALLTILHHLHGCDTSICSPLTENNVVLNLEVVAVCDRFMIDNLSKNVQAELIRNLTPESVKTIYAYSVKYNYQDLSTAVLKYVMVGEMSSSERVNCFRDLKSAPTICEIFIGDIKETILKQFPESKSVPKLTVVEEP